MNPIAQASNHPPNIPCVILAGGQSRRFGSNKAFAKLHGERLIDILIARLEKQTTAPVVINAPNQHDYGLPTRLFIADWLPGNIGPLAGLHAALCWAAEQGYPHVVTVPVDTPSLPDDFIAKLAKSAPPSVATCAGRAHPVHGIWPAELQQDLQTAITSGMRAARAWQTACAANLCPFPQQQGLDPFANINRPEDLAALEQTQPPSPR